MFRTSTTRRMRMLKMRQNAERTARLIKEFECKPWGSYHIKDCSLGENWKSCPPCVENWNLNCLPREMLPMPQEPYWM